METAHGSCVLTADRSDHVGRYETACPAFSYDSRLSRETLETSKQHVLMPSCEGSKEILQTSKKLILLDI